MLSFSLCTESAVAKIAYISHLVALDFNKLAWGEGGYLFFSLPEVTLCKFCFPWYVFLWNNILDVQHTVRRFKITRGGGGVKRVYLQVPRRRMYERYIMASRLRLIGSGRERILMRLTDSRKMTKNSAVRREKLQILTVCCKKKIKLWKIMMTTMDSKEI